jgi:hypothetical protein
MLALGGSSKGKQARVAAAAALGYSSKMSEQATCG